MQARRQMHGVLQAPVRAAVEAGDLLAGTHPPAHAFKLYALASAGSQAIRLEEPGASAWASRCTRALLGTA